MRNDVIQALRAHQQADAEGVMVLVSREACELAATLLEQRDAQPDERAAFEAWAAEWGFMNEHHRYAAWEAWQAARAASPAGWKLVPVEPTEAMLDAALECQEAAPEDGARSEVYHAYKTMLAARPAAQEQKSDLQRRIDRYGDFT